MTYNELLLDAFVADLVDKNTIWQCLLDVSDFIESVKLSNPQTYLEFMEKEYNKIHQSPDPERA